jgi:hypothetical protein
MTEKSSFEIDCARLDFPHEDSAPVIVNVLINADDRKIVHCWVSLRRADLSELQKEGLCFSNDPHSEPGRQAVKGGSRKGR